MNDNHSFEYTYSSPKREFQPALVPVDREAGSWLLWAVLLGVASCLLFGLGMAFILHWNILSLGILFGLLGIIGMAFAPVFYSGLCKRQKGRQSRSA